MKWGGCREWEGAGEGAGKWRGARPGEGGGCRKEGCREGEVAKD